MCTQDFRQNKTFWPYKKDWTLGAASTKNKQVCRFLPRYTSIQNLKEIRQEMQLLECTQEYEKNMTFDPIKDGTLRAGSPKNYSCVDFYYDAYLYKIWKKYVKNKFPPKYDLWPYKTEHWGQHHKRDGRVDFTKIHLHGYKIWKKCSC